MRRWLMLAPVILAIPALGCFEITEEISIREDGSARYVLDVSIAQEAVSLGDAQAPASVAGEGRLHDLGSEFRRAGEEARQRSRDVDEVSAFDVHENVDPCGFHHFVLSMEVRDAEDLAEAQQAIFAPAASRRSRDEALRPDVHVEDLGDQSVGILRRLPRDGMLGTSDEPAAMIARALAKSTLAGHELRVVVRGPSIVSANGHVADDRKSVEWRLPLGDVASGDAFPQELRAEVRLSRSSWPLVGLVLFLGLLAGVGAILWLRHREPETWRS